MISIVHEIMHRYPKKETTKTKMAAKNNNLSFINSDENSPNSKMKLSKSILEMKFMKRTKDKVEQQMHKQEGEKYFSSQLTTQMEKSSGNFIIEPSFVFCEGLIDGRLSFQGANPEIEKIMESEAQIKREEVTKKEEDAERKAFNYWENNRKTKFNKNSDKNFKRKSNDFKQDYRQNLKKPKFIKPEY